MTQEIYEYSEGKQARENFEKGMKSLFQAPKDAVPTKKKARKKRAKKTSESDVCDVARHRL